MSRQQVLPVLALLLAACSDPADREGCIDESPSFVDVDVIPNTFGTIYADGNVIITGTAEADIRIDRLLIGGLDAKGTRDNFASWSIELTPAQLSQHSGLAMLSVEAIDVCGGEPHDFEPVPVLVKAPPGTPASGLEISATPIETMSSGEPECYLPADASAEAAVTVLAAEDAVGVGVALSSAIEGEFFGASEKTVILEPLEGASCQSSAEEPSSSSCAGFLEVIFRPTEAGRLRLAASAGPSFDLDGSGLRAVGAPEFVGTSAAVPPQTTVQVVVETDGRLRECFATTDQPSFVSVDADGVELTSEVAEFDDPECGQREAFDVQFLEGAPVGLSVKIECVDTYDQAGSISLIAGAAPETDTGA